MFAWNAFSTINAFFAHMVDKYVETGDIKKMRFAGIVLPQIVGFILRGMATLRAKNYRMSKIFTFKYLHRVFKTLSVDH